VICWGAGATRALPQHVARHGARGLSSEQIVSIEGTPPASDSDGFKDRCATGAGNSLDATTGCFFPVCASNLHKSKALCDIYLSHHRHSHCRRRS
jgi:hypothetical protein